jgi:hypothetical protein
MSSVRIGPTGASSVSQLLSDISRGPELPDEIRDNANRGAPLMRRRMDRRDVERIAILLWNICESRASASQRRQAQYWATYLEGRM